MDYNALNKMDRYFNFIKKNQKRWQAKENIDYKKLKTKKMGNSMTKYREDQEDKIFTKPIEIKNKRDLWGYIIHRGVKFFNGDIIDADVLNNEVNLWIGGEWIIDIRHPMLSISDLKKIQKYLTLEIERVEHNTVFVQEDQNSMFGSVMIHYKITCTNIVHWDMIKKYFDYGK